MILGANIGRNFCDISALVAVKIRQFSLTGRIAPFYRKNRGGNFRCYTTKLLAFIAVIPVILVTIFSVIKLAMPEKFIFRAEIGHSEQERLKRKNCGREHRDMKM